MPLTTPRLVGLAAATISAITFGCLGVFSHILFSEGFNVTSSLAWRFTVATVILTIIIRFSKDQDKMPAQRDRINNMIFGGLGYGVAAALFFFSMQRTTTGLANTLLFQNPMVVFLLSIIFSKARPSLRHCLVLLTSIVGLLLVCWPTSLATDVTGILAGAAAAIWYGAYLFLAEKRSRSYPPIWLTLDVMKGSALGFILTGIIDQSLMWPPSYTSWLMILAQSVICTLVPVLALILAIRLLGARDATLISSLEPVIALILGILFLDETWELTQLFGSTLLVGAIVALHWPTNAKIQSQESTAIDSDRTIAYWNTEESFLDELRIPVSDRSIFFADAVYEVIRIYNGKIWLANEHFDRLQRSLAKIKISVNLAVIITSVHRNITDNKVLDGYVYIQVSRGCAPRNHSFPDPITPANVLIYAKTLTEDPWLPYR